MKELRELIQNKLEEIQDLECSPIIPEELMEIGKVYFIYSLQRFSIDKDEDKNHTYNVVISGFIKTKDSSDIDVIEILDNYGSEIIDKLQELNFSCDIIDITDVGSSIRKQRLTGSVKYNEINKALV